MIGSQTERTIPLAESLSERGIWRTLKICLIGGDIMAVGGGKRPSARTAAAIHPLKLACLWHLKSAAVSAESVSGHRKT
jgi:hypothetical protein